MKHFLQNKEFQLDEILFETRNKNYGAYRLRKDADWLLTKSLFIGIGIIGLLSISPIISNAFKSKPVPKSQFSGEHHFTNVDENTIKEPPLIHTEPPLIHTEPRQTQVKEINTTVPEPTLNPNKEHHTPSIREYEHAIAGTKETPGTPPMIINQPPNISLYPTTPTPSTRPKAEDQYAYTKVDQEAMYKGGIDAFRNKVSIIFDTDQFDGSGEKLSTMITFIVEKDGRISNIKANGKNTNFNSEAEITISKIKGNWQPAKIDGVNVRSYISFPISMVFD